MGAVFFDPRSQRVTLQDMNSSLWITVAQLQPCCSLSFEMCHVETICSGPVGAPRSGMKSADGQAISSWASAEMGGVYPK